MSDAEKGAGSLTGLSEREAKEFHVIFANSFVIFLILALTAHFLVWQWKPWLVSSATVVSMADGATALLAAIPNVFTA
jgi:light-harvesting complex 1 beta chain